MSRSHPEGCEPSKREDTPDVASAKDILRGTAATPKEMQQLADRLKDAKHFGLARELLGRAWAQGIDDAELRRKVRQKLALCTYKDPDLSADERLTTAFEILSQDEDLGTTTDQESLGLAGAIFKRRWELDTQKHNLERSLSYYLRGYRVGPETDQGYTGINAAFVLDLLASLEAREADEAGDRSEIAERRAAEARAIREDLVEKLPPLLEREGTKWLADKWWFYATMVEALFGLGPYEEKRYKEATEWVTRGLALPDIPDWEYRTTATQLASLARVQSREPITAEAFERSPAGRVLATLLGERAAGVRTAFIGKVGLGLSGGGFRASLFHIGVLARLAELDVLRHVEVLSCVSGGSILGAHYYLEIKRLLERTADADVKRGDYIDVVKRLETQFLEGIQKNIRTRVAAEFTTNLKMIFLPGYSRTMRAGELYERHLYSRVQDGNGTKPRWITDLYVKPAGECPDFKPREDNWRRRAKVPDLILNATTLNTGHNWQFTASWMGEPPGSINTDVDGNYRLRRMYYWEAPEPHRCIRLGYAVGASACVPGLFEPLALKELYPDVTVRLVDGGVHDNQGIVGLLETDCSVVLVSDASGQMGAVDQPSAGVVGVPLRSNSILMSRVRTEQYDELMARSRSGLLRGVMFIHLMQDLDTDPVDWVRCQDPHHASDQARPSYLRGPLTRYGVRKDVQRKIAEIRTDLDSFSDAEAFALMNSGYRMTKHAFEHDPSLKWIPVHSGPSEDWRFLAVDKALKDVDEAQPLLRLLNVASKKAFKVWHLLTSLKVLAVVLGLAALVGAVLLFMRFWESPLLTVGSLGMAALAAVGTAVLGKGIMRIVQFRSTLQRIGIGIVLAVVGWLAARIHLWVFDKLFLKVGRVANDKNA